MPAWGGFTQEYVDMPSQSIELLKSDEKFLAMIFKIQMLNATVLISVASEYTT